MEDGLNQKPAVPAWFIDNVKMTEQENSLFSGSQDSA
jgi:hypothetical protein